MDVPALIITLLKDNGLTALLLIYLIGERVGPTILNKILPSWRKDREHTRLEALEREKMKASEDRETSDRLFKIAESIVESNGKLNYTLTHISEYLQGQSVLMREISLDIARIYTHLRIDRDNPVANKSIEVNSRKPPAE